jgi:uncharacterized protein with ParB-like and HNH nuclease domain
LEIAPTVDEEQVADIFVRINSEGVKLNQADFILTLLSVFLGSGEGRSWRSSAGIQESAKSWLRAVSL